MMLKKLLCSLFVLALVFSMVPLVRAGADSHLDEIEKYNIKIDVEKDATLDMTYHIEWKVLDSTSEGPLTWVKIGIENQYVDNLKALSDSISAISTMNDGGDYVRLDLDRSYQAGETVPLDFSIHQSHMYTQESDGGVSYNFTPGWFDGADVKSLAITWNNENVESSDATKTEGNYLLWTTSLAAGERYSVSVRYGAGALAPTGDTQTIEKSGDTAYIDNSGIDTSGYGYDGDSGSGIVIVIFIIIFIIIIIAAAIRAAGGGGYRGGFGGTRFIGYGGGGHCACACACGCACACACAGGGRAGCSAKNFYGASANASALKRVLKQD